GDPDQDEDHPEAVHDRPRPQGRQDPDRNRDREPEDRPAKQERGGARRVRADDPADGNAVDVRVAEGPVANQVPHEQPVLLVDRQVEVEAVPDVDDLLGRAVRTAGDRRRVARYDEEDDVGDYRRAEEQEDGPEEATDEEIDHWF